MGVWDMRTPSQWVFLMKGRSVWDKIDGKKPGSRAPCSTRPGSCDAVVMVDETCAPKGRSEREWIDMKPEVNVDGGRRRKVWCGGGGTGREEIVARADSEFSSDDIESASQPPQRNR
jgi:hypothetical protein